MRAGPGLSAVALRVHGLQPDQPAQAQCSKRCL